MKLTKWLSLLCAVCLCLTAAGCGDQTAVYVQSVSALSSMGGIAPGDRFAGMVVSENVTEIKKDGDKSVKELLVKAGDDVTEGQALFSYDTDQLQLNLDKLRLELDQMYATAQNYRSQINTLTQERNSVGESAKLQYTIQIQSTQLDLKETELRIQAKETEITQAKALLENATVVSPINGRVQSISDGNSDYGDTPGAYITIQQVGSYRIKGTLGELQRGALTEGNRVKIFSRTDSTKTWSGTITLVDYENPSQGNNNDRYYGMVSDEMTATSKYPFYVELDNTDGLILGQHIYMEMETDAGTFSGPAISSAFICYEEDGSAYVWAEKRGKLEKRAVTLGEYNMMADTQEITSGLTMDDYIAFPDPEVCQPGAPTTYEQVVEEIPEDSVATGDMGIMEGGVG